MPVSNIDEKAGMSFTVKQWGFASGGPFPGLISGMVWCDIAQASQPVEKAGMSIVYDKIIN